MNLIPCTFELHASQILDIFNDAIVNSTALYEYKTRTLDDMVQWFADKTRGNYPVHGLVDEHSTLMGFASYGVFRARPAYKYTVEHSVYVHPAHRGKGVGKVLMEALIQNARQQGYHVLIGGVDASNTASVALHEKLGFILAGTLHQTGFKFGQWLDLAFYQLTLDTPLSPVDD